MPLPRSLVATALLALPLLAACSSSDASDDGGIDIAASTDVYADIAQAVAGPDVEVTAFIDSPSADPHSYEANSRNILTVTRADIVIENGGGYDDFMDTLLESAKNDPVVLNAVETSGRTAPEGEELNEHVWYDLPAMQQLADEIAGALSDIDPDRADDYTANAAAFNTSLQAVIDRTTELRTQLEGTPVAITEPVPGYLIEALGLKNLTPPAFSEAIEEGEDVSVGVLDETLRLFSDHQVEALIYNDQTTGTITDQVESAAKDAGIAVVPVSETLPDGTDYVGWMSDNVEAIANALGAR